jgi:signal-transduction protein with cAMP-binding, CBS, and nucleotidyltransferase domain
MTKNPLSVEITASYSEMEAVFVNQKISTLLVKKDDVLIGLIRADSLMNQ